MNNRSVYVVVGAQHAAPVLILMTQAYKCYNLL